MIGVSKETLGFRNMGHLLIVNERTKLTRFQHLKLPDLLWRKAPSLAALK